MFARLLAVDTCEYKALFVVDFVCVSAVEAFVAVALFCLLGAFAELYDGCCALVGVFVLLALETVAVVVRVGVCDVLCWLFVLNAVDGGAEPVTVWP